MSQPTSWQNEDLSDSVSYYLGEVVFKVIVLILTMAVSSHIIHGFGTAKAKKTFMGLFFLSLTLVQYYYIIKASKHIPSNRFYSYKEGLILPSCQESFKGGKASSISNVPENINPCYTHCIGSSYGQCTNGSQAFNYNEPPFFMTSCPLKGFKCNATIGRDEIPRYISSNRDCAGGFGGRCSMAQPCHPCDLAYIREHKVGLLTPPTLSLHIFVS